MYNYDPMYLSGWFLNTHMYPEKGKRRFNVPMLRSLGPGVWTCDMADKIYSMAAVRTDGTMKVYEECYSGLFVHTYDSDDTCTGLMQHGVHGETHTYATSDFYIDLKSRAKNPNEVIEQNMVEALASELIPDLIDICFEYASISILAVAD